MEKKMVNRKTKEFAFEVEGKEKLKERLRQLVGTRSVRAAARDWGLSFSTLNNYLTKNTEPSFSAIKNIANKEQVSLDWIAYGSAVGAAPTIKHSSDESPQGQEIADKLTSAWLAILDSLDEGEAQALLRVIHKKGVDGIVEMATANSLDMELLQLPVEEKERLMALHEAQKGAFEDNQDNDLSRPTHKAG
ncbi:transcriptional regulator [Serratia fonticola]|uniref:transcriptional regulator n=1 Tax=Serratia fonticola TaxID=47917 RepID=UPI003AADE87E